MSRLISGLKVHRYAPEINKLHLRNRQTLPVPGITIIKEAKARLFGRWQPGHQVTITISHPDYINLSRLYRDGWPTWQNFLHTSPDGASSTTCLAPPSTSNCGIANHDHHNYKHP